MEMKFKKEYLEAAGSFCPFCRSEKIEAPKGVEVDAGSASQQMHCFACGGNWYDQYELVDVEAQ